jgi:hypothetical protein
MHRLVFGFLLAFAFAFAPQPAAAQFGQAAVTTTFADADTTVYVPDDFDPGAFSPLSAQPTGAEGAYRLTPGAYTAAVQSFCLHAGTYGPSKGAGYLHAPLRGARADIIRTILRRASDHPELAQSDVQRLLWVIEADMTVRELPRPARQAAEVLLSPQDLASLATNDVRELFDRARALAPLPPVVSGLMDLQARMRALLSDPNVGFAEIERLAVRSGLPPRGGPDIPRGRWSAHPSGAFVRYLPEGYSRTTIEVYVPPGPRGANHAVEFDPRGDVAVPANTSSQRLGISGPVERATARARR